MHIVFCSDRNALPGMHVAVYSLLDKIQSKGNHTTVHLFSQDLQEQDLGLLQNTMQRTGKPFKFFQHRAEASRLKNFPALCGSRATYFRLLAPEIIEAERFLYVDADTLCDLDVSPLEGVEMGGAAAGLVPEAPIEFSVDLPLLRQLGEGSKGWYFNAGVLLVQVEEWRSQRITERCLDYLARHDAAYHDQSALNFVLREQVFQLDQKFNCRTNARDNWPDLTAPLGATGKLLHFVDYPKPWDLLGEWVHPHFEFWRQIRDRTALHSYRSYHPRAGRKWLPLGRAFRAYKKAIKDKLLFTGYAQGWFKRVKGIPDFQADQRAHSAV